MTRNRKEDYKEQRLEIANEKLEKLEKLYDNELGTEYETR